jgi:hypothetical protein
LRISWLIVGMKPSPFVAGKSPAVTFAQRKSAKSGEPRGHRSSRLPEQCSALVLAASENRGRRGQAAHYERTGGRSTPCRTNAPKLSLAQPSCREVAIGQTWEEYWDAYVLGHRRLATRLIHYAGLFVVPILAIGLAIGYQTLIPLLAIPVVYLAARETHPLLESNSNKPFAGRPLWSAIAFGKMLLLDLGGRMGGEIKRASAALD